MNTEWQKLELAIATLEAQRAVLGDAIVESALGPMRERLLALREPAPIAPAQALKQVTILFLDLVDSTRLSQRLDPEEISRVLDGALVRATTIVTTHGGKVLQYAGDNLLAAFGAEAAREDDAERAIHCGLALLVLGRELRAEVHAEHGLSGFDMRIGAHTGNVLLGGGIDKDHSIRGTAVHIAARLEQAAPPGGLRVSRDTYALVRGVFDVVPQQPLTVKGIDAPVASFLVQRVKPRSFRVECRGIEGVATRMIGRDVELEALQAAFHRSMRDGAGLERITVVAEAGVGKSRLLYEFRNWAESREERYYVLQARASPQTQGQPYGLLHDVLAWRFEIGDHDPMEVARAKFEAALTPLFVDEGEAEADAHVHLLGQLIGLDYQDSPHVRDIRHDGRQIRARGFHAAARALRRIATRQRTPLILYLDDLHWADDASLDFLDHLAGVDRDVPMLIVELARPSLFERHGHAATDRLRIDLPPLGRPVSLLLADELLQKLPEIPTALRELITGGADGNPFYMEELVKMLISEGAIDTQDAAWTLDANRLLSLKVPPTLTGVLQARLDALPQGERHALQLASVIGLTFWDAALAHVEATAVDELRSLTQRELVHRKDHDEGTDGVHEYAFHHQILHQVTYDTVLRPMRRAAHAKTAEWLAERSGARAKALLGTAAEHYELAGDAAHAAEFYARSAEHNVGTFANEAALDRAARGLRLAASDDLDLRWRLHITRENALEVLGRRAEQRVAIEALIEVADTLDDDARRFEARMRRANHAIHTSDFETAEREARQAQRVAVRSGDAMRIVRVAQPLSVALAYRGDPAGGRRIVEEALERADGLGEPLVQSRLRNALSICAFVQGDLVTPLHCYRINRALCLQMGDRRNEVIALSNLGLGHSVLGDFETAHRHLEEALQLNRSLGDRANEGNILLALANIVRRRDAKLARTTALESIALIDAAGSRLHLSDAYHALGDAELALDRPVEAMAAFERSEAISREIGASRNVISALEGRARAALARHDDAVALDSVARLLAAAGLDPTTSTRCIGDDGLDPFGGSIKHRVRLTLHAVWSHVGDPRADAILDEARRVLLATADAIHDDALRAAFLDIPEHREIVARYGAMRSADVRSSSATPSTVDAIDLEQ